MSMTLDKSLIAKLGLDESQVDLSETKETKSKQTSTPNKEKMKTSSRKAIKDINIAQGKDIQFMTLVRDCFLKDGKTFKLDKQGKKIPRYIAKKFNGYFAIDKQKDGTFIVTKVNYYSESHQVVDFVELGKMQTSEEVAKAIPKK